MTTTVGRRRNTNVEGRGEEGFQIQEPLRINDKIKVEKKKRVPLVGCFLIKGTRDSSIKNRMSRYVGAQISSIYPVYRVAFIKSAQT